MSQLEIEILSGRLFGMGRQADCIVGARKVSISGTGVFEYRVVSIHNEPDDLPDGQYELKFAGQSIQCQRNERAWLFPTPTWS